MTRYMYQESKLSKNSSIVHEDKISLWLKKVTDNDIKEKDLLNNHQISGNSGLFEIMGPKGMLSFDTVSKQLRKFYYLKELVGVNNNDEIL